MQTTFRSLVLALAVAAVAAFTPNSAKAETSVQVPFSFTAAGRSLPAGRYIVAHDSLSDTVTLRSKDANGSLTWIMGPSEMDPTGNHVVLQFDAVGPMHVLRQIHYGSSATARLDKVSHRFEDESGRAPSGR
jgi:hypothetical protein